MGAANKDIVRRLGVEPWEGNLGVIDELVAPDYVGHDPSQPDLIGFVDGDEDAVVALEDAQHVEALDVAEDLFLFDPQYLGDALRRIDGLVSDDELSLHWLPPQGACEDEMPEITAHFFAGGAFTHTVQVCTHECQE